MSLEVLRQVRQLNEAARESEAERRALYATMSPETPSSPLPDSFGGQTDTASLPPLR